MHYHEARKHTLSIPEFNLLAMSVEILDQKYCPVSAPGV